MHPHPVQLGTSPVLLSVYMQRKVDLRATSYTTMADQVFCIIFSNFFKFLKKLCGLGMLKED